MPFDPPPQAFAADVESLRAAMVRRGRWRTLCRRGEDARWQCGAPSDTNVNFTLPA